MTKLFKYLPLALAGLPAIFVLVIIWSYGSLIPLGDQWDTPGIFTQQWAEGEATFESLFSQHNESRKAFTRILWTAMIETIGWNPRVELTTTWITAVAISVMCLALIRRSHFIPESQRYWVWALMNVFIFGLSSWEYWNWGLSIEAYIPTLCLLVGIWMTTSKWNGLLVWPLMVILLFIAMFSYANGLFLMPIFITCGVARWWTKADHRRFDRFEWLGLAIYLLGSLALVALYFHDYVSPEHHPGTASGLKRPLDSLILWAKWMAAPLFIAIKESHRVILFAGFFVLLLQLSLLISHLWRFGRTRECPALLLWGPLLFYVLFSGLITSLGRVEMSTQAWATPRYICFSTYGIVAMLPMLYASLYQKDSWLASRLSSEVKSKAILFFCTVALTLSLISGLGAFRNLSSEKRLYKNTRAQISLYTHGYHPFPYLSRYPHADANVFKRIQWYADGGYLDLLDPNSAKIQPTALGSDLAQLDEFSIDDEGNLNVHLWARPQHHSYVLLRYRDNNNSEWKPLFYHSPEFSSRKDLAINQYESPLSLTLSKFKVPESLMPEDAQEFQLMLWYYGKGKSYLIPITVTPDPG